MRSFARRALLLAPLLLTISTAQGAEPITVLLVRHAEKAAQPADDPPLTPAGRKRALALRDLVRDAELDAIFATNKIRTQQTVGPAAELLGLKPTILDIDDIDGLAEAVQKLAGKTVLVGSHGGKSLALIEKLGGPKLEPLAEHHYDNFFVVTVTGPGRATVARLKYGEPTP
jgi:broad specificity phosphatase PhoE